ncbi:amidohydrolase [Congregibacter variabilis]|uniref:Amidohydrolase n=1 Tax=Congregibacter variabilis TaxID=3081200 RepID=A0ABZ0I536_9GAMM|nr:amidohydrolase [Congregibacter sp. IMCC43200]
MKLIQSAQEMLLGVGLTVIALSSVAAPEMVFFGGPVITMNSNDQVADALAIEAGRIVAVGDSAEVLALADENTRRIDLKGKPLLPGFVDSHSHANFIGVQAMSANLLPPPDGEGASVASLQRLLREYMSSEPELQRELGWIIGFGYDDSQLAEQRHPTRHDLDAVSTEVPILLIHQSGHLGVANTVGLKVAGIGADTPDPDGGAFRRESDGKGPNGVAEEYAFFRLIFSALAAADEELQDRMLLAGTESMASFGYTTAQEGRASPESMAAMQRVADRGELKIDLVSYPDMLMTEDLSPSRSYENRYRVGGVKLTIDGSPQGKTAWLSLPYHVAPHGKSDDYVGYPAIDVDTVNSSVMRAFDHGWQILVHSNGDAATDALLNALRLAREKHPDVELRPVLIHGQVLRKEQVAALDELDVFPSLFPMHTFYWGDWHRDSVLGPKRAENISPTGWVRERGMMFGSHHDAPVAKPDSMRVLSATVTRTTRSGAVLGADHRVDVMTGLRALTIWPAWQHFEEADKGTLEVGKLADLVVLSDNPLTVDPGDLDELQIRATYKEGHLVYQQDEQ